MKRYIKNIWCFRRRAFAWNVEFSLIGFRWWKILSFCVLLTALKTVPGNALPLARDFIANMSNMLVLYMAWWSDYLPVAIVSVLSSACFKIYGHLLDWEDAMFCWRRKFTALWDHWFSLANPKSNVLLLPFIGPQNANWHYITLFIFKMLCISAGIIIGISLIAKPPSDVGGLTQMEWRSNDDVGCLKAQSHLLSSCHLVGVNTAHNFSITKICLLPPHQYHMPVFQFEVFSWSWLNIKVWIISTQTHMSRHGIKDGKKIDISPEHQFRLCANRVVFERFHNC